MLDLIRRITKASEAKKKFAEFRAGDTIEVFVKVKEGEKERVQIFKGVVIKMQGAGISRTFTVRKISDGVGVERTFPLASPSLDKVGLVSKGKVRRSKLYYLRALEGKKARIESEVYGADGSLHSVTRATNAKNDAKNAAKKQKEIAPSAEG